MKMSRNTVLLTLGLLIAVFYVTPTSASVIVNEVMYHSKQGAEYDFIELYNTGSSAVDLTGWSFTSGISFTFPPESSIGANGYAILAQDMQLFSNAYGSSVPSGSKLFGPYSKKLNNDGDSLQIKDKSGNVVVDFKYDDSIVPTDGFGSSMELLCPSSNPSDIQSWRASAASIGTDKLSEFGGTPGRVNTWNSCSPTVSSAISSIIVTEIMYDPSDENNQFERHEFLEFFNNGTSEVDLSNYRLVSDNTRVTDTLRFTFPAGSVVPAGSYFLVVKSKSAFSAVYPGVTVPIFGEYTGQLKNGGDHVLLLDLNGLVATEIEYDSKFPWPTAAKGVGEQYKGHSLSRVSFGVSASKTYNWVADLPSPGIQNPAKKDVPSPIATELEVSQGSSLEFFVPNKPIAIKAKVSPAGSYSSVGILFYQEDYTSSEHVSSSGAFTLLPGEDNTFVYNFTTGFPGNTILRFVITADGDANVISPRSNDRVTEHSFFVSPENSTKSDYHLFIRRERWTNLWHNLNDGREKGIYNDFPTCCVPNDRWNNREQSILGYKGKVYDVTARYQGSGYNRMYGDTTPVSSWQQPGPTLPSPLLALSWKLDLSKGVKIGSRSELYWIKPRDTGCNFLQSHVMFNLARQLGLAAPKVKFARVNINGAYFHYYIDIENYSEDLIDDYIEEFYDVNCKDQASEQTGFLYKATGFADCNGVLGVSSEKYVEEKFCSGESISGLTIAANAYPLDTHKSWANHSALYGLTDVLGGGPNQKDFKTMPVSQDAKNWLISNFDVDAVLNYIVLVNWAGAWDDIIGNHMLYQRLTDGKWQLFPWDMDSMFGRTAPCSNNARCSLNLGDYGADVGQYQTKGEGNPIKSAFIRAFEEEFQERYRLFAKTVLSYQNVNAAFTKAQADLDPIASNGVVPGYCATSMLQWHQARGNFVRETYGNDTATSAPKVCPSKPTVTKVVTSYASAPAAPGTPSFAEEGGKIKISWSSPNNWGSSLSFILQKADGDNWNTIYDGADASYVDGSLSQSNTYRVRAVNAQGSSAWSSSSSADLPNPQVSSASRAIGLLSVVFVLSFL